MAEPSDGRSDAEAIDGFGPVLLGVDVSTDQLNPGEELWITSRWRNDGTAPAAGLVRGFCDMEFGHQRRLEIHPTSHRVVWDPAPGAHGWKPGQTWRTTCRWKPPRMWGGTFELRLGLCDGGQVPLAIVGPDGRPTRRVYIGDVEVGWGWGQPTVDQQRRAWSRTFHETTPPAGSPPAPGRALSLCGDVSARLDPTFPALLGLADAEGDFDFGPAPLASPAEATLRCIEDDAVVRTYDPGCRLVCDGVEADDRSAVYACLARQGTRVLARFSLRFELAGRTVLLRMEDVRESSGWELLAVSLPALAAAGGDGARMVDFFGGGRLIDPNTVRPAGCVHPYDVRNAGALLGAGGTVVVESDRLDDLLHAAVHDGPGGRQAVLGITLTHRVAAHGERESLPVVHLPEVRMDLLDRCWGKPSWQAAARFLRKDLQPNPYYDRYRRALVYKQLVSFGPQPPEDQLGPDAPSATRRLAETRPFREMIEVMRRLRNLLDGGPQVFYVTGWQYRGFDTGYPYVYDTDPRLGTVDDLRELIRRGPEFNAAVSMHDNYDDCYFGETLGEHPVAVDARGRPWKGWIWPAGLSYITGFRRYAESGQMAERVRRTVEQYGFDTSYHLDVLSSEVRRYDYHPAGPAAADACLAAKRQVVAEFNRHGVDVTSETLTHPFVGHIGWAWATRDDRRAVLFHGEAYIPLTSMVYHGTIDYNCRRGGPDSLLWAMIQGAGGGWTETYRVADEPENLKWHYALTAPMAFLADAPMADCRQDGDAWSVDYGPAGRVEVDLGARSYEIVHRGRTIGRDFETFIPGFAPGVWLAYSLEGGPTAWPAPEDWPADGDVSAVALTGEGEGQAAPATLADGQLRLDLPPGLPVRVTCAEA